MKKYIVLLFLIFTIFSTQAQVLKGTVYDAETKDPIVSATVYLNGTSYGTMTDKNGHFVLNVGKKIITELVVRIIGYMPFAISNPFDNPKLEINLEPKNEDLKEVIVMASPFSRKQMLKAFKGQFLGVDMAGKSCIIRNEEMIELTYNTLTNTLIASCEEPIVIDNNYLGYSIAFLLTDFRAIYRKKSIKESHLGGMSFYGTFSINDISKTRLTKRIMINNRLEVYEESTKYFFKNFVDSTLTEASFQIFNKENEIDRDAYFQITDSAEFKKVELLPNTDIAIEKTLLSKPLTSDDIGARIDIVHRKRHSSGLIINTPSFLVDRYGNISSNIRNIYFNGALSINRVGRMLPLDFEP